MRRLLSICGLSTRRFYGCCYRTLSGKTNLRIPVIKMICYRKIATLRVVSRLRPTTADYLSVMLGVERTAMSHRMGRYYKQGLLDREKEGKYYVYWLSKKGRKYLHSYDRDSFTTPYFIEKMADDLIKLADEFSKPLFY